MFLNYLRKFSPYSFSSLSSQIKFNILKLSRCTNVNQHRPDRFYNASRRFLSISSSSLSTPIFSRPVIDSFTVANEPLLSYEDNSNEKVALEARLRYYLDNVIEIPIVIGGKEYFTDKIETQVSPFNHSQIVARCHLATPELAREAIKTSLAKSKEWKNTDINYRIRCLLKAADLASGKYRQDLNATTMLGQGKTIAQAEIDSAAELTDFFRFNAYYLQEIYRYHPIDPSRQINNSFRLRDLEGFVAAISPFNFTAIAANLCSAPALVGNAVVWKPSPNALLSNWVVFKVLKEAGFAEEAISFLPSTPKTFSENVISSPDLAAVNFTGSVATFRIIWKTVAQNLDNNKTFPRLIGECGGKDFHLIHSSADLETAAAQTIRAAFEYSGQKCSACSRLYVAKSIFPEFQNRLLQIGSKLKLGSPLEKDTYLSAVINEAAFKRNASYLDFARQDSQHQILLGGNYDNSKGYFIDPSIVLTTNPRSKLMVEEIFGPILSVFIFDDKEIDQTLELIDQSTGYGLTGAVFATDREFLRKALEKLKYSAGNFYINDKCTGAIVAQQPFGGARLSGTNDKAGAPQYLLRWLSPQNIKETFVPLREWK
ncbi:Delta-1-pyrroline-5-carboxylate dehydrogenase [Sarcoptes scabiei]|uniref:Multifunctional fusion protein n=1 Tax=Sarcoptes scabiei TaxID=52283 RepID=A0A834VEJ1_SARSC|nr:Delta-1-pyrroline-5-carboxylate dehydrogenase [Sarcoptes scabiei]